MTADHRKVLLGVIIARDPIRSGFYDCWYHAFEVIDYWYYGVVRRRRRGVELS